ncbi:MAG: histidine phosphatase family protein [Oscillospiraceae bacterium]|jgi:alpha-ribazole phosphatase
MKIVFIRHGKTAGNLKRQYIGKTDQPLCKAGISELNARRYPTTDIVISSPMRRCIQTAEIIYKGVALMLHDDLKECDFGTFEEKNHVQLSQNSAYKNWLNSNGEMPFPDGESPEKFKIRCCEAFEKAVLEHCNYNSLAFVVHGGTIMAVLEKYAVPKCGFYDYQVKNACGYVTDYDIKTKEISIISELK